MTETPAQRTRAKELNRIARLGPFPLGSPFKTKVVGVSFTPGYPRNLHTLMSICHEAWSRNEYLPAIIVRETDNRHDPNCCAVHVTALGEDGKIGVLTAPMAARLAPELDADVRWRGEIVEVLLTPGHEDRPGITIRMERITE